MKKLISLVLALAMLMMVGAAFASETPADGTFTGVAETTINASNLDSGDTVYYIQLVEWNGSNNGTATNPSASWKLTAAGVATGYTVDQLMSIDAEKAAAIATALASTDGTAMTTTGTNASANVAPGLYYLRAVASSDDTIYNPAFVSADYYQGGNSVDFSTTIGSSAVVKKSSVTFDKQVGHGATHEYTYNDVKPGDYIPYKITTTIPAYGANYDAAKFEITDTFSTGLVLAIDTDHPFTVTYGSATTSASVEDVVTITGASDGSSTYKVAFAEDYLLSSDRATTSVTVIYWGKVTTDAPTNVNYMDNTADLEYTNKPGETSDKHDITRHYTFSIDANLLGDGEKETSELIKIGMDQNGNPITEETVTYHEHTPASPLAGASFTLTPVSPTTGTAKAISSDANGRIVFKGLDAGTYTLVENSAPTGYVKDSRTYTVVITPTYNSTTPDLLDSYKIEFKLDNTVITTSEFTMTNSGTVVKTTASTIESDTQLIGNTQGTELPSTGGIGTTIFYIVGGMLLVGAAIVLVARRKASN